MADERTHLVRFLGDPCGYVVSAEVAYAVSVRQVAGPMWVAATRGSRPVFVNVDQAYLVEPIEAS